MEKKRIKYKCGRLLMTYFWTQFLCVFCVVRLDIYSHLLQCFSCLDHDDWVWLPHSFTYKMLARKKSASRISLNKILNIVKILTVLSILLIIIHSNNKHVCMYVYCRLCIGIHSYYMLRYCVNSGSAQVCLSDCLT